MTGRFTILLFAASTVVFSGGCYEERIVRDSFADLRAMSDNRGRVRDPARMADAPNYSGFTVLIAQFDGPDREQRAQQVVNKLIREAFVSDLWIKSDEHTTRILQGIYHSASDRAAQHSLLYVQGLMFDGTHPFAEARLIALDDQGEVVIGGEYDLRRHIGMLSLQIGFYDEAMGDFRQAAEEAVAVLRRDGVDAYYYHGPNMSHVTVGLFTEADRVQRVMQSRDGREVIVGEYSDRVRALQQQFPYNLGNGHTLLDANAPGEGRPLPSFLVEVPH